MKSLKALLCGWILGCAAPTLAQPLALSLNDQNVKIVNEAGRMIMTIDLLAELKKQHSAQMSGTEFEMQSVVVEAKSRMGGGQIMLKVRRRQGAARFVDLQRVETDPAIFESGEGFQRVELVNFERNLIGAELIVVGGVRLRGLQVVKGAAGELALAGVYGGFDASKVAGARDSQPTVIATEPKEKEEVAGEPLDIRPVIPIPIPRPADVERRELPPITRAEEPPVVERREISPSVTQIETRPKPKKEEARPQPARCLQNFCVGQAVYHRRTYWEGVIVRVDTKAKQLIVKFGYDEGAFEAPVSPRDLEYN